MIIDGYAVERVCSQWFSTTICCFCIQSDPGEYYSISHPDHPRQKILNDLRDAHGVQGIWPSAFEAAKHVKGSVIELGAGAGLPSLVASVVHNLPVLATDVEELPLKFLKRARETHPVTSATFDTKIFDVRDGDKSDLLNFDTVVAADMLYDLDVAEALGILLREAVEAKPSLNLVVCDPGRRGRDAFLSAFGRDDAKFVEMPSSHPDLFDGRRQDTVGLLTLG